MENRSCLARVSVGAGLLLLLLAWQASCVAYQSTPAESEESLAEKANDPTATLTQPQVKNEYTPSQYGTNAQPNTLILRGILAVQPHGPLNLEQIIRPTFQIVTKPLGKGAATRTGFGDTQLFDLFIMPWPNSRETGFRWGVGPYFVFPTASWHGAGQGAWQLDLHGPSHIDAFRIWLSRLCFSRPPHLHAPRPSAHRLAHSHLNRLSRMNFPTSSTWLPMRQPGPGTSGATLQLAFRS